jgi:hypothetical protein
VVAPSGDVEVCSGSILSSAAGPAACAAIAPTAQANNKLIADAK